MKRSKRMLQTVRMAVLFGFAALLNVAAAQANEPPVANPGGPYEGQTGTAVFFDGRASTDPDGNVGYLTFEWAFDDGSTWSGPTASHTYEETGDHPVTLTVTDEGGETDTGDTTATISDATNRRSPFRADLTVAKSATRLPLTGRHPPMRTARS